MAGHDRQTGPTGDGVAHLQVGPARHQAVWTVRLTDDRCVQTSVFDSPFVLHPVPGGYDFNPIREGTLPSESLDQQVAMSQLPRRQ